MGDCISCLISDWEHYEPEALTIWQKDATKRERVSTSACLRKWNRGSTSHSIFNRESRKPFFSGFKPFLLTSLSSSINIDPPALLYQRSQSSSWVPDPFYRFGIVLHPVCDWSAYRRPLHILANSPCWSFLETESRLDPLIQGSTALKYFYISFLCLHLLEANTSSKLAF